MPSLHVQQLLAFQLNETSERGEKKLNFLLNFIILHTQNRTDTFSVSCLYFLSY